MERADRRGFERRRKAGASSPVIRSHYNTAAVKSTYLKVLILQVVVLIGLWILQQAFL
jgi:hypothetical protein